MKSGIRLAIGLLLVVSLTITMTACSSSGYAPEDGGSTGTTTVVVHHGYGYGPGWGGGWGGYYPGGGVVIGGPVIYH